MRLLAVLALMLTSGVAWAGGGEAPALWSVAPFVALLLCIAICPLAAPHFWHHHYAKVAIGLGLVTGAYYVFGLHNWLSLVHVGFEYFSFICLLAGLFIASGGIVIRVEKRATPLLNVGILLLGALISNIIGTTGAAMLLIRPFMRVNQGRLQPYHIIFFIFMVANVGGSLTPIGDPPLFLGYLKGIAFFQFFELNILPWLVALGLLSGMFFVLDSRNKQQATSLGQGGVSIQGAQSFVFLALVVGAVFLDPNKMSWLPCITITDHHALGFGFGADKAEHVEVFSFVREVIQLSAAIVAFKLANPKNLEANGFNFEPIKEVGYLFIGIFLTMVPALALIKGAATDPALAQHLSPSTFYFGTGMLSAVLDNAPTFLSFLAGLEGKAGLAAHEISVSIANQAWPIGYEGSGHGLDVHHLADDLSACAVAAVFWGAGTYIGNGPNFMVKSIADNARDADGKPLVTCPSFFGYVIRFTLPFLLPVLLIVWLLFFSPWEIL